MIHVSVKTRRFALSRAGTLCFTKGTPATVDTSAVRYPATGCRSFCFHGSAAQSLQANTHLTSFLQHQRKRRQQHQRQYFPYTTNVVTTTTNKPFFKVSSPRPLICSPSVVSLFPSRIVYFKTKLESIRKENLTTATNNDIGKEKYLKSLEALEKVNEIETERERVKSEEMYKAWESATEKQKQYEEGGGGKNRAGGVAVVKTIVKQTRKELKKKNKQQLAKNVDLNDDEEMIDSNDEEYWKRRSRKLLEEAALTHKYPEALVRLGNILLEEVSLSRNKEKKGDEDDTPLHTSSVQLAVDMFRQAGEQGCQEGWFNLGQLLWTGYPEVSPEGDNSNTNTQQVLLPNRVEAMNAFWKSIDAGDADAMYFVGVHLLAANEDDDTDYISQREKDDNSKNKSFVEKKQQGLDLIQTAAKEHNHGGALYYLALFHLNGDESLKIPSCNEDYGIFTQYLNAACEQSHADALFLRGHCYFNAEHGYDQDFPKALKDFIAAAQDGDHADAAVSAGAMLHSGKYPGVKQDQFMAFQLYQHAGELGSVEGWRNVVACYAYGEGVPQSKENAKYIASVMLKDDDTNEQMHE